MRFFHFRFNIVSLAFLCSEFQILLLLFLLRDVNVYYSLGIPIFPLYLLKVGLHNFHIALCFRGFPFFLRPFTFLFIDAEVRVRKEPVVVVVVL